MTTPSIIAILNQLKVTVAWLEEEYGEKELTAQEIAALRKVILALADLPGVEPEPEK